MEKVILAIAFALAVFVGATTDSSPNDTRTNDKTTYEIPPNG
ncbi:hypothetical protein [uncultured Dokdonia sp.]|nr:hypothetical protein [uncultured Dokdonia sp.]